LLPQWIARRTRNTLPYTKVATSEAEADNIEEVPKDDPFLRTEERRERAFLAVCWCIVLALAGLDLAFFYDWGPAGGLDPEALRGGLRVRAWTTRQSRDSRTTPLGEESVYRPAIWGTSNCDLDRQPASERMRLVYAFQGAEPAVFKRQLDLFVRSVWSAYTTGCRSKDRRRQNSCRRRIVAHVFVDPEHAEQVERRIQALRFQGVDVRLHPTDFDQVVTTERKVWGPYAKKLSLAANYYRFYAPEFLATRYGATSFLYLDSDTMFTSPGLDLWFDNILPLASAGVQAKKNCWFSKIVPVDHEATRDLKLDPQGDCLAASVLLVNITEWQSMNITRKVETWLAKNKASQIWILGSMPPLMLALYGEWEPLPNVGDGKGKGCQNIPEWRKSGTVVVHPFKDYETCPIVPPRVAVCFDQTLYDPESVTGTTRLASRRARKLAELFSLGQEIEPIGVSCTLVFARDTLDRSRAPRAVWIRVKPPIYSLESVAWDLLETDNLMEHQERLAVFSDKPPVSSLRVFTVDGPPLDPGMKHDAKPHLADPLLCYHGNYMHIQSLLPLLAKVTVPFRLRIITGGHGSAATEKEVADEVRAGAVAAGLSPDRVEVLRYSEVAVERRIYDHLVDCDLGLVPQMVRPVVDMDVIAKNTEQYFERVDEQKRDVLRRCKLTENGGRAFIFYQIGVPVITDACPMALIWSHWNDGSLAQVVYTHSSWPFMITAVLQDYELRSRLSEKSFTFANEQLTYDRQARHMAREIGCWAHKATRL